MQNAVASMTDAKLERFIGKQFLDAFNEFRKERDAVTDVEPKETNVNNDTPVSQES
jgi:hypothetical protein